MKDKLAARLFGLQKKLSGINSYDEESGKYLFRYSIEFERVLLLLMNYNQEEFTAIYDNYNAVTGRNCWLVHDYNDKNNKAEAFYSGVKNLNACLTQCLARLRETDHQKL